MKTAADKWAQHKADKKAKAEKKPKKHFKLQPPVRLVEDKPVEDPVEDSAVEKTEEN